MRVHANRLWVGRVVLAAAAALAVNLALAAMEVAHDAPLVALLTVATITAAVLALESLEAHAPFTWTAPRPDARPRPGEDTRTAVFRQLIEVHETSREGDDSVLWQIADLAKRRLRQVHGIRYADDPVRARELLGPMLADLVALDRRSRYQPGRRHHRYTLDELGELVLRVERL